MPTLGETQRLLWSLITAPEGVAKALAEPEHGSALTVALDRTVLGDERMGAVERLDVYANMYFFRLLDVLKGDYPAVLAVLGESVFHDLITDYLLVHFPSHPSLRYAGATLPAFLARHKQGTVFPFLSDLARLEWALVDAFDAANAPILSADDLVSVPPEHWGELRFRFHPSVRLLDCDWGVHVLRQRADLGEEVGTAANGPVGVCVWRRGFNVFHRALSDPERCALGVLREGGTFAEACTAAAELVGEEEAPHAVAGALATWLNEGLLSGLASDNGA